MVVCHSKPPLEATEFYYFTTFFQQVFNLYYLTLISL
ncbi:hypothetical protein F383_13281 [Gossypium arboreum]|uniref:Uncharacterized protein n=1 Tax=Gossypium arboreum TaxID=29729 RepID=A0A0B0NBQ0_GOSAR|nr:hypothetical protein F383_13281 [Gossypium arboreum]